MASKKEAAKQIIEELYTIEEELEKFILKIRNIEAGMELYFPHEYKKWNIVGLIADAADYSTDIRTEMLDKYFTNTDE
jgi:transcriptional accessory protein Tex/SPT6